MFTSCGSEADNHAIVGALEAEEARRRALTNSAAANGNGKRARDNEVKAEPLPHVVTSNIEHPAIVECVNALQKSGRLSVTTVACDAEGRVSPDAVAAAVTPQTVLVSVMHSNNEVGSIQPIGEIARAVRAVRPSIPIHTDAAQSVGKVALDVRRLGVQLMTVVGHKFGAPKGVAALYVARGTELPRLLHGGGQESGRRAGTECVLLLSALGEAARIASRELGDLRAHMAATRARLAERLVSELPDGSTRIHGPADEAHRLPNTLSIGIRGVSAPALLERLSERLAASAGAACHTGAASMSPVLCAMGVPAEFAMGTLRLSSGRHTSMEEVEAAADLIIEEVRRQWNEGKE